MDAASAAVLGRSNAESQWIAETPDHAEFQKLAAVEDDRTPVVVFKMHPVVTETILAPVNGFPSLNPEALHRSWCGVSIPSLLYSTMKKERGAVEFAPGHGRQRLAPETKVDAAMVHRGRPARVWNRRRSVDLLYERTPRRVNSH